MKFQHRYLLFVYSSFMLIALMAGCKYDVAEPMWERPYTAPATPTITRVEPTSAALAGDNYIKVYGTDLVQGGDSTLVYFGSTQVDVLTMTPELLVIRRPGLAIDSCSIKIVPRKALVAAKYGPYKITNVISKHGNFLENLALSNTMLDAAGNLYVCETVTRKIWKVSPDGQQKDTMNTRAARVVTDAFFGPDGNMYYLGNNRIIDKVDVTTKNITARWTQLPSGKSVKFADMATNGYFYTAGIRTDLLAVSFASPSTVKAAGVYSADEVLAIKVNNGFVYVAWRTGTSPAKVSRHSINADGTVGTKETLVDLVNFPAYSSSLITSISFDVNGNMFLSLDDANSNSLLKVDATTRTPDVFYKGIIPKNCKKALFGKQNYMYVLIGDDTTKEEWTVYKVDMGVNGAQ